VAEQGSLIKQDVAVTQLRWKGQKFDQNMGIEEQVEAELACAGQRMYALFRRRKLNLLTT
jgi:hypothetical protein